MALCTSLVGKVDALEKDKLAQATKNFSLEKRVEKLEKRRKSKPSVLRRLRKIGSITRVESLEEASLGAKENASKQRVISYIDDDAEISLPAVTTFSLLVTTDSVTITTTEPISVAAKELTDNDMTMAKALAELKTSKPKVPSVTQKIAVSFISSSKGKAIMIESEKLVKIKDLSAHDEQVAKDLHDKIQVELEEEAKRQEEASMATLAELYDAVQAQIDVDQKLAARLTLKVKSTQFTHAQLKHRDFEEIQGLYNKENELVDTFVPIGSEEDERRIKDLNTKAKEESSNKDVDSTNKRKKRIRIKRSSKKQKTDADLKEEEQIKTFPSIVRNEEEAVDFEVLDKRVFRADRSSRYIKTFTEMVSRFDRMDFLELHSLLMNSGRIKKIGFSKARISESESEAAFDLLRWGLLGFKGFILVLEFLLLVRVTTCTTAAAAAAPMTAAAVEQLIEARVSTALANHETLQNSTNGHGDRSHNSNTRIRDLVVLSQWFEKMELVFHISNCAVENQKALKKMMTVKYYPRGEIKKLEIELWNLKVKGTDVASYTLRFQELALMCGRMFHEESEEVEKYFGGFPNMIQGNVMSYQPKMMEKEIKFSNDQMDQKVLTITERQAECNKCKKVSHLAHDYRSSGPNGNNNNRGNFGTTQNVVTCYECGVQGNFKKDYLKLKNGNCGNQRGNGNAPAKVYVVGNVGTNLDSNIVTGTFLLNDRYASILFDTSANRSFVSTTFSSLIDITPTTLDHYYDVELADGKIIRINTIIWGCTLNFLNHPFNINLMPVELGSFDVIIGMDWLLKYHDVIDCAEKIVRIPWGNETLIVHGDRSNQGNGTRLNIISCTKTHKYLLKAHNVFLAHVTTKETEDKLGEKRLEDVPIVRDFPKVFLEDLSGLPLTRQVEF
ncbi:putative reverse transcriptase domain-containing protein [Tanacetum coccineum]|uniref:Reverse transcriptase domain-containing protein n=1 Tax=Tanacetum coccineum TaxID=301880 RepID=A0ABQ5GMD1_9ASTR